MIPSTIDRGAVLEQLDRVLRSDAFRRSGRSSTLLRFLVERALDGAADQLKEYTVGVEALGRGSSFDPRIDPVVRAEASRLRDRLERYYTGDGRDDLVLLALPKGSYVPRFESRATRGPVPSAAADAPHAAEQPPIERSRAGPSTAAMLGVAVILVALGFAGAAWLRSPTTSPKAASVAQFEVELGSDATLGSEVGPDVALSADGTRLVFAARDEDNRVSLFTRRLDEARVKRLPGTEGGRVPFLSPDGRWIGFWADGKLKRTPVEGGSPVVLCDATDVLGASWGDDGFIVAALNPTGKLWRIPENGGAPRAVVDLTTDSLTPQWPQLLPNGRAVVYAALARSGADQANVEAHALSGGERKVLVRGGSFPQYLPNGYLTYVNQGTLYAIPFDAARLEVHGAAVPVLENVAYSRIFGYAHLSIARSGTLVYRRRPGGGLTAVATVDRAGRSTPVSEAPGRYNWARGSPDARRAAFTTVESGRASLQIVELRERDSRRVVELSAEPSGLTWWPDGRWLILGGRGGMSAIDVARPDAPRALSKSAGIQVPWSLSPGGQRLAYYEFTPGTAFDLWTVPVRVSASGLALGEPEPFVRSNAFEVYPDFSPDGRWIAYSSNETGRYEIYVRPFAGGAEAVRVSTQGGRVPAWSRTKPELLFQTDGQRIMVAAYRIEDGRFVADPPLEWAPLTLGDAGVLPSFSVMPDGDRILALLPAGTPEELQSRNHVTVVMNFHEAVRRRLAAREP